MHSSGTRLRKGVSLVDMVVAISVAGTLLLVAVPRFSTMNANNAVHSAQTRFVAAIATARAAAIQRSTTATLRISAHRLTLSVAGGAANAFPPIPFDTLFGVKVEPANDSIVFGPRGLATSPNASKKYIMRRSGARADTVCVTKLGVVRRSCETL
jgi:type II secretory pathway pseudopilin PulG